MKRSRKSPSSARGAGAPPPREEGRPERFLWIVDGHNAIFARPAWERLQVEGRRREARLALEQSLQTFGRAIGRPVWVVYDGNRMERNPDALDLPHLRTWYSDPPEEADDRILFLVQRALGQGERPLVVTSDRRTLAARLPSGARSIGASDFFHRVYPRVVRSPEKWKPGGMRDIEEHFLRASGEEDAGTERGERP